MRLVLISIACSWAFLYLDSVYQRRRAEALFADLRALDFATAGFPEIRDIVIRYGGHGIQRELLPRFPAFGGCTPRDCTFRLWIMSRLPRIPVLNSTEEEFFYSALPFIGVRSWVVVAQFEVRDGKLDRSQTAVSELRMERLDSSGHQYLVPLGYEVQTQRDAASFNLGCTSSHDYHVHVSHGYPKLPAYMLTTCVLQSAGISTKRAFDVHLHCLNILFRSCTFDELAPSAWADHSARDDGTGTRDPYK